MDNKKKPDDTYQGVRSRRRKGRAAQGKAHTDDAPPIRSEGAGIAVTVLAILAAAIIIAAAVYFVVTFILSSDIRQQDEMAAEMEASEVSDGEADDALSDEERRLAGIKEALSGGESVLSTLRIYYPDDLVLYKNSRYVFVPRDERLKTHDYKSEDVTVFSSGEYVYSGMASGKGIDVSSHQGDIDWELVAGTGIDFVFIRALYRGYGTGKLVEDEKFRVNYAGAGDNDIGRGVYIFTQALNEEEVEEEISLLEDLIGDDVPELPVVVDVEEAGGGEGRMDQLTVAERTELISYYCERLEEEGYTPMIYFNMGGALLLVDLYELEDYAKWFAVYDTDFYYPYDYTVWQYSDSGSVDGIEGDVDLDIYFGEF